MAIVFRRKSIVQAWLAGIRYLSTQEGFDSTNVILEIDSPLQASLEDKFVVDTINAALQEKNSSRSVMTAAGTIFPQSIYQRYGRPAWYDQYKLVFKRGKARGTWGTYVMRMIERTDGHGKSFNPLEDIVTKLSAINNNKLNRFKSAYEMSVSDPCIDLKSWGHGAGFDLATYNPISDRNMYMGSPCLSHLTFKIIKERLDMTAIYRSHYYAERALGNLVGLAQLQRYVAEESGFLPGALTCISTYAKLDDALGGVRATREILASFPRDENYI